MYECISKKDCWCPLLYFIPIGLHSNGYSLVRKVLEVHGLAFDSPCPFDKDRNLGEVLLTPTRIYVKSVLPLMKAGNVKAFVHVTGIVYTVFT